MLAYIAQFALDLQYDGLMIESHINPKQALSDAAQQLTPAELGQLLNNLEIRKAVADSPAELSRLEDMRDEIDQIDHNLVTLLAERMAIARKIGKYKFINNVMILQPERWAEILKTRTEKGINKKLTREFILKLYNIIHEESIVQQTGEMNEEKANSASVVKQSEK
jgi:chorismate mutase